MENESVQENVAVQAAPVKKRGWLKNRPEGSASIAAVFTFCGSNFFTSALGEFVASYFVLFLTDYMLIPTMQITTFMFVTRLIDAITDPIMGGIVDITHTKWGKTRPYLLASGVPFGLFATLMFVVPNISIMGRLVYCYAMYICLGIASTVFQVPLMSASISMTNNPKERKNIYTIQGIVRTLGTSIPGLVPILLQYFEGSHAAEQRVYFFVALTIGIGSAILMTACFFTMKDKVVPIAAAKKEKEKLTKNIKALLKNRPLMCLLFSSVALSLRQMGYGAAIYFYKETMGNVALATYVGILSSIPTYIAMGSVPFLAKKFSPRSLMISSYLFIAATFAVMFFVGYESVFWVGFFIVISGTPNGIIRTVSTIAIADSVDYMEWRTGVRSEGLVFSVDGLKGKATSTLSGMWLPIGLTMIGYHTAQNSAEFVIQSDATKQGLFYLVTLAPMAGSLIAAGIMFLDNFYGKRRERIFEELAERRKEAKALLDAERAAKQNGGLTLATECAAAGGDASEADATADGASSDEVSADAMTDSVVADDNSDK